MRKDFLRSNMFHGIVIVITLLLSAALFVSCASSGKRMPDGSRYIGELNSAGKPEGNGTLISPDGVVRWEGNFKNGVMYGIITMTGPNLKYTGEVKNGLPNGKGILLISNGVKREGEFQNGALQGKGTEYDPKLGTYEGEFKDNKYHGKGTLKYLNGSSYEGEFRYGAFYGKGTMSKPGGIRCEMNFKDGKSFEKDMKCFDAKGKPIFSE